MSPEERAALIAERERLLHRVGQIDLALRVPDPNEEALRLAGGGWHGPDDYSIAGRAPRYCMFESDYDARCREAGVKPMRGSEAARRALARQMDAVAEERDDERGMTDAERANARKRMEIG